jgi:hypothetical protein
MQVGVELPEDIVQELRAKWKDMPGHVLEAIAAEGYRSGALTEWQVQRILGYETRLEVHRFLRGPWSVSGVRPGRARTGD